MTINNINIQEEQLKEICKRYLIKELAIFGSALREDFNDSSDVDLLYTFQETASHSLFDIIRIKEEFEKLFGRSVDPVSRRAIERSRNKFRKKAILKITKVIYAA
jgi:uncharacterized protein